MASCIILTVWYPAGDRQTTPPHDSTPSLLTPFSFWASSSIQIEMPTARTIQLTCQWKYATVLVRGWDARAAQRKAYVSVLQHDLKDTKIQFERIPSHPLDYLSLFQLFYSIHGRCPGKAACFEQVWCQTLRAVLCVDTMQPDGGDAGHSPTAGHRHQEVLYVWWTEALTNRVASHYN